MLNILFSILPIFFLILIGYLLNIFIKNKNIEIFWNTADAFVYYLFFPAMLILDISGSNLTTTNVYLSILCTVLATITIALVILIIQRFWNVGNSVFTSIFQGSIRYNSYVFFALSQSIFGEKGVALSSVFVTYMIILTNVMSVIVMNHYGHGNKKTIKGVISALSKNPLIIGSVVGLALNMLEIQFNGVLKQLLTYLSNAATPLSLMSVGVGLVFSMNLHKIYAIVYSVFIKLLIMPACTFCLIKLFGINGLAADVALLYATMPCAGNAYILARQMGGDTETMASIITWTTLLSVISVAVILGTLS